MEENGLGIEPGEEDVLVRVPLGGKTQHQKCS